MSLQYQRFTNIERVPSVTNFTHLIHCVPFITKVYKLHTLCVCSLQHSRFTHLVHVIHCLFPSTPTVYTPGTCHTLPVPFDTHVLHTWYMSYTACSLRHPRFTHLLHDIHCLFPSTSTFYTPATCHTLSVPFDTHILLTWYMSYTACSLQHPRFTHLLHVIHCVFPSTPTCD